MDVGPRRPRKEEEGRGGGCMAHQAHQAHQAHKSTQPLNPQAHKAVFAMRTLGMRMAMGMDYGPFSATLLHLHRVNPNDPDCASASAARHRGLEPAAGRRTLREILRDAPSRVSALQSIGQPGNMHCRLLFPNFTCINIT